MVCGKRHTNGSVEHNRLSKNRWHWYDDFILTKVPKEFNGEKSFLTDSFGS